MYMLEYQQSELLHTYHI